MGQKSTNRRSFFGSAIPGGGIDFSRLFKMGIVGLLLAVGLSYCGGRYRDLSMWGGPDEISAETPWIDTNVIELDLVGEQPGEQPTGTPPVKDRTVPRPNDEDNQDEDSQDEDEEEQGKPISDVVDPASLIVDLSRYGPGSFDFRVTESGVAECGYPDGSYDYDVTITIGQEPEANLVEDELEEADDWATSMTLLRFKVQYSTGRISGGTAELIDQGDTYSSTMTVQDFDPETGERSRRPRNTGQAIVKQPGSSLA